MTKTTQYIIIGGIVLLLLLPKRAVSNELVPGFCPLTPAPDASTAHFDLSEFHSNDGVEVPFAIRGNIQKLMTELEMIRSFFLDRPVIIISGFRSPEHNTNQDGVEESKHMCGMAVDIRIPGVSANEVQEGILNLINTGFIINGGLGRYNSHTHYDIGPSRRWDERN